MAKVHVITFLISCECLSVNSNHSSCCPRTVSCVIFKIGKKCFWHQCLLLKFLDWTREKALFWSLGRENESALHCHQAILAFLFTPELSMTRIQIDQQALLFKTRQSATQSQSRKPPAPWWILFDTWTSPPFCTPWSSGDGHFFQPRLLIPH